MRNRILLIVLLGGAASGWATTADSGNAYHSVITGRNVFGLVAPPPPATPADLRPPPPKVTLIGIVNAFGTRKAVLKSVEARPAAPGQLPALDESLVLREAESQQGITVLAIDETSGCVKIDNHGVPDTLTFEKNGVKPPSGPAPAPAVAGPDGSPKPNPAERPPRPGSPRSGPMAPVTVGAPDHVPEGP
jgi:hypothetical protein